MTFNMPAWIDITLSATPYHVCGKNVHDEFHGNNADAPELLELRYTSNCQLIIQITFPKTYFEVSLKVMFSVLFNGHRVGQFLFVNNNFNTNFQYTILLPPSDTGVISFLLDQIMTDFAGLDTPAGVYNIPVVFEIIPVVNW